MDGQSPKIISWAGKLGRKYFDFMIDRFKIEISHSSKIEKVYETTTSREIIELEKDLDLPTPKPASPNLLQTSCALTHQPH